MKLSFNTETLFPDKSIFESMRDGLIAFKGESGEMLLERVKEFASTILSTKVVQAVNSSSVDDDDEIDYDSNYWEQESDENISEIESCSGCMSVFEVSRRMVSKNIML